MADMGVVARVPGGPEAMEWTELDTAAPNVGEARIAQHAVGVNFIDTYFRSGLYPWPSTPLIPGAEASGVVEDVGPGVTDLKPGDRVAYTMPLGAYRTRRVVPADRLVKLPESITFETAASVMLKGLTAQFLLTSCFAVKQGHVVLVHAAAGGVGLLLGQWLKSLARHRQQVRGLRREGARDHPRCPLRRGVRLGGQRHVARLAQEPEAARHVRVLRPILRSDRGFQDIGSGDGRVAVRDPADAVRLHQDAG
jgi:D-arabinose 1-dehydrogenase-like Zn-dependent alcohol dehydrogenase